MGAKLDCDDGQEDVWNVQRLTARLGTADPVVHILLKHLTAAFGTSCRGRCRSTARPFLILRFSARDAALYVPAIAARPDEWLDTRSTLSTMLPSGSISPGSTKSSVRRPAARSLLAGSTKVSAEPGKHDHTFVVA